MSVSKLKSRKLSLIEFLLSIQDEKVFDKLEANIQKSLKSLHVNDFVLTKNELKKRANISTNQIKAGKFLSQKALEDQSKNW
jgi:hypothetical protein